MIRILIVDDERPIANLIKMSLTKAGYSCTCVYDGLAAADILETRGLRAPRNVDVMTSFDLCSDRIAPRSPIRVRAPDEAPAGAGERGQRP